MKLPEGYRLERNGLSLYRWVRPASERYLLQHNGPTHWYQWTTILSARLHQWSNVRRRKHNAWMVVQHKPAELTGSWPWLRNSLIGVLVYTVIYACLAAHGIKLKPGEVFCIGCVIGLLAGIAAALEVPR